MTTTMTTPPIKYTKVILSPTGDPDADDPGAEAEEEERHETIIIIGRIRISVGGMGPTVTTLQEQTLLMMDDSSMDDVNSNTTATAPLLGSHEDLCVLGGVLLSLEQFARHDSWHRCSHRLTIGLCLALLLLSFLIPVVIIYCSSTCTLYGGGGDGANTTSTSTLSPTPTNYICEDQRKSPGQTAAFVMCFLVVNIAFVVAHVLVGRCTTNWGDIEARLDDILQDLWNELRPTGYTISRTTEVASLYSCGSRTVSWRSAGSINVDIRRPQWLDEEDLVDGEPFCMDSDTEVGDSLSAIGNKRQCQCRLSLPSVDQQLSMATNCKTVIDLPTLITNGAAGVCLPVDRWVTGGLMLRLRVEQYCVTGAIQRFDRWIMSPLELLIALGLLGSMLYIDWNVVFQNDESDLVLSWVLLALMYLIPFLLRVFKLYVYHWIDNGATSDAVDTVVTEMSKYVSEQRHGYVLQYFEIGDCEFPPCLPKGNIQLVQHGTNHAYEDEEAPAIIV